MRKWKWKWKWKWEWKRDKNEGRRVVEEKEGLR